MGAGQSTPQLTLRGAGSREINTPGVFVLMDDQRKFVDAMGLLLKTLLTESTNLGSLKELLKKNCSSMFMTTSGDAYAQMWLQQNATNPGRPKTFTVVPKDMYKEKYEIEAKHMAMCAQYTSLMLRLTEVTLALFASIHINQGMAALRDLPNKVETLRRSLPPGEVPNPMPTSILENYKLDGYFQEIETGLYVFKAPAEVAGAKTENPRDMVVFDVFQGLIYYAGESMNKGPTFRLSFSEQPAARAVESQSQPSSPQYGYGGYPDQRLQQFPKPPSVPTFGQNPAPVSPGPSSSALVPYVGGGPAGGPLGGGGPPRGGGPLGGGGGNPDPAAQRLNAILLLGIDPSRPITRKLLKDVIKQAHPDRGGSGPEFPAKYAAAKFLEEQLDKEEEMKPPSSDALITFDEPALDEPLLRAQIQEKLEQKPPKTARELEFAIREAVTAADAARGGPATDEAAKVDIITDITDKVDITLPQAAEAIISALQVSRGAVAVLPNYDPATILNLVEGLTQEEKEYKRDMIVRIMTGALDANRIGKSIAERKRQIQMSAPLNKIVNPCLPEIPRPRDIRYVVTELLNFSNKQNLWGDEYQAYTKIYFFGAPGIEQYCRNIVGAKVSAAWPLWQMVSSVSPPTDNCPAPTGVVLPTARRSPRRNTRRAPRRSQRKSRKQRGGAKQKRRVQRGGANFFTITIDTIPKSERSYQLVLTTKGVAMNPADVKNPNPSSTSSSLTDLFMRVILKENTGTSAGSSVAGRFRPLDASDVGTYDKLTSMYDALMTIQEGPSLAAYRAFSLLSNLETGSRTPRAYTYVCKDKMAGRKASDEVQYATLESLFLDIQDTEKPDYELKGKTALQAVLQGFVANARYTHPSPTVQTFSDLMIPKLMTPEQTRDLCTAQGVTGSVANVEMLKKAHRDLRGLYDKHIDWVRTFVTKNFMIIRASDKQLVINPRLAFPSNNGKITTIQKELEHIIELVRAKIANYYANVEIVYARALAALGPPY